MLRTRTAAVLAVLSIGGLAACGGDDGGDGGVKDALDAVAAGEASQAYFAYTDLAAIGEQTQLPTAGQPVGEDFREWTIPASMGGPVLMQSTGRGPDGIDPFSAQRALTIGAGGDNANRLDGLEEGPSPEALEALSEDSSYADGTLAVATSPEALAEVLGDDGASLGDSENHAAIADCLGDVVAAAIMPGRSAGLAEGIADTIGLGVRGGDEPEEVFCAVGMSHGQDDPYVKLKDNLSPPDNEQVASADSDDGETGDVKWDSITITLKEGEPRGYLYRAILQQLQLRNWVTQ